MVNILQKIFPPSFSENLTAKAFTVEHEIYVATLALFIEMAYIDGKFSIEETQHITQIFTTEYGLDKDYLEQLTRLAEQELKNSHDLWKFTNLINRNLNHSEKIRMVELIWKIIYADGKLDSYEDYLIHKLARLLNLAHSELINAKLKILHQES
jgi:uncharacterized tellurite resistance protein B-like protein